MVKLLLQHVAKGMTPLAVACRPDHADAVALLSGHNLAPLPGTPRTRDALLLTPDMARMVAV